MICKIEHFNISSGFCEENQLDGFPSPIDKLPFNNNRIQKPECTE